MDFEQVSKSGFWLTLVGILWGCSNPLMKLGSEGITKFSNQNQNHNSVVKIILEFWYLFTRWQYVIPFLINMIGSVIFFYSLSQLDLSLVGPICNSLTFLFTTITSRFLFPTEKITKQMLLGMLFVVIGVAICVKSKEIS